MSTWADLRFRVKRLSLDAAYSISTTLRPFRWKSLGGKDDWLNPENLADVGQLEPVPNQIFVLWTGSNPLTPNRVEALKSIRASQGSAKVILVTEATVHQFEIQEHPFNSNWKNLSLVHRADYLRSYLMHHYGGGYVDLKRIQTDWAETFERLEHRSSLWAVGYPEVSSTAVAEVEGNLGQIMRRNYRRLIGNGAFIFRPQTPLTIEWLAEVERRIDLHAEKLQSFPGNERGTNPGYPVRWTEILGEVLAPLVLKYNEHVESTKAIRPEFKRYL